MTPTDTTQSDNRYPDDTYLQTATDDDARLQPDPEPALSGGKTSRTQIVLAMAGALVVLGLVMYGITQPHNERQIVERAPSATTGAAPSR